MAQTCKNLWPQVHDWENLWLAFRRARRGKRTKQDVCRFEFGARGGVTAAAVRFAAGRVGTGPLPPLPHP